MQALEVPARGWLPRRRRRARSSSRRRERGRRPAFQRHQLNPCPVPSPRRLPPRQRQRRSRCRRQSLAAWCRQPCGCGSKSSVRQRPRLRCRPLRHPGSFRNRRPKLSALRPRPLRGPQQARPADSAQLPQAQRECRPLRLGRVRSRLHALLHRCRDRRTCRAPKRLLAARARCRRSPFAPSSRAARLVQDRHIPRGPQCRVVSRIRVSAPAGHRVSALPRHRAASSRRDPLRRRRRRRRPL